MTTSPNRAPGRLVANLVAIFEQEADKLNGLDAQLGDGDHGLSMLAGLRGVLELSLRNPELDWATFLKQGGSAFNEAAGSTIGILIMSAMKAAGQSVDGKAALTPADLGAMLEAGTNAIMARGKAKPGQKTILDSLIPAQEVLLRSAESGVASAQLASQAADAARAGAEETADLISSTGRARWFKERSVGIMDPGAWSGYLIVKTIGETLLEEDADAPR
jgi:dihydroxyacetone kinase-like protein